MSMTEEEFLRRCLTFACRHCNARKGEPCRDTNLRKAKPHSDRRNEALGEHLAWERLKIPKCPTCGQRVRSWKRQAADGKTP